MVVVLFCLFFVCLFFLFCFSCHDVDMLFILLDSSDTFCSHLTGVVQSY